MSRSRLQQCSEKRGGPHPTIVSFWAALKRSPLLPVLWTPGGGIDILVRFRTTELQSTVFELTVFSNLLFVTTAINTIVFVISWRRRASLGGRWFALGMLAIALWTLAAALDYASVSWSQKVFFAKVEYTTSFMALALMALFSLEFAGFGDWFTPWHRRLLFFLPSVLVALAAWTNELHHLLWTGHRPAAIGRNAVIFEHGPIYGLALIVGYTLAATLSLGLLQVARHGSEVTRRQGRLLFLASLVPVTGNLIYLLQSERWKGIDWSSLSFTVSGVLFLAALQGARFLDLSPIARDQLVRSMVDGMIVLDASGRVVEINRSARQTLTLEGESVLGERLARLAPVTAEVLERAPASEGRSELEISDDSSKRFFDVIVSPLSRGHRAPLGRLLVLRDVTQRRGAEEALRLANERMAAQLRRIESLQASLQEQVIRDPLTNLHNRRFFDEIIGQYLHGAARLAQNLSIVVVDLDYFKRVNDEFGHAAGDDCLVRFAEMLRSHVRRSDIACRYGGEEFLLVLADTGHQGALAFAENLRERVENSPFELEHGSVHVTLSAGVATYPDHGFDPKDLVDKADQALYRAKDRGRNRVEGWAGGSAPR